MSVTFETIAQKIKRLREEKGLTKYRLAKLSGLDEAYIGQLESGRIDQPRRSTKAALAKGLGVSLSVFTDQEIPNGIDAEIKSFLVDDFPKLDQESKDWVKLTINMVRERQRKKYNAEGK
jgi:transcriptional regulator with XRE-family HTH domain